MEHSISHINITPAGVEPRYQSIEQTDASMGRQIADWTLSPDGNDFIVSEIDSEKAVAAIC